MIGHTIVAFLISLAVGYWVLTLAEKQSGFTKTLGQVFAGIIIVVSLLGPVGVVASAFCHRGHGGYGDRCSWGGGWHRHGMGGQCMMGNGGPMGDNCPMMGGHKGMMKGDGGMGMGKDKAAGQDDNKDDSK